MCADVTACQDRFFSRVAAALAGKDYFTLPQMMGTINAALKGYDVVWEHMDKQWDFSSIRAAVGVEFHRLRNAHSLCFTRTADGIAVRWRQWLTDSAWSRPVLLITTVQMQGVAMARPKQVNLQFPEAIANGFLSFLDKLDILLAASGGSTVPEASCRRASMGSTAPEASCRRASMGSTAHEIDRHLDMAWLRRVARGEELALKSQRTLENIIDDLSRLGRQLATSQDSRVTGSAFPEDTVVQLFPGSDVPEMPLNTLVQVKGCVEELLPQKLHRDLCGPGSFLLTKNSNKGKLPFLLAMMVDVCSPVSIEHCH